MDTYRIAKASAPDIIVVTETTSRIAMVMAQGFANMRGIDYIVTNPNGRQNLVHPAHRGATSDH